MRNSTEHLVVSLLTVALLAGCQVEPTGSASRPIVDGSLSGKGAHPETVFLWLGNGSCTGTLIAPRVILTARHCVEGVSLEDLQVYFGNDPSEGDGSWAAPEDYIYHDRGDIALIALARPAATDPIPYRRQGIYNSDLGREVLLVGFGDTGGEGSAGIKREGRTVLDDLSGDLIFVGTTGSKTCFGDSGGPTFVEVGGQKYVIGVASFVTNENCQVGASGNVRPDMYANWIDDYVAQYAEGDHCGTDAVCGTGCAVVDPDCPCSVEDGLCSNLCEDYLVNDVDCSDCGKNGVCDASCPDLDPDCCDADSICNTACETLDPDCAALGESCSANDECQTNLCAQLGGESRCSALCDDVSSPCPAGFSCLDGGGCWPEEGGCNFGGSRVPGLLFSVALLLGLGLIRRRVQV